MKRIACLIILCLLALILATLAGCSCGEAVSGTGIVKYIDLEGGFYGIIGDDNKQYEPMNLEQTYQQDGLRVRFQARIRKDMFSIHMWGTIIEITKIETIR